MNAPNTVTADFNTAVTQQHTLTVTKSGDGTGRVASSPAGIDCGPSCTADFPQDTVVTLTATPDAGSVFDRWDLCTGTTGPCNVFMGSPQTVKAFFKL